MKDNNDTDNEQVAQRRAKLNTLRESGNPFPNDFRRDSEADHHVALVAPWSPKHQITHPASHSIEQASSSARYALGVTSRYTPSA